MELLEVEDSDIEMTLDEMIREEDVKLEDGAENLNQVLQKAMNPNGLALKRGGTLYRVKDKVMQIRNDYDKEVFNGDIGTISFVDLEERELKVDFDGREVTYDVTELDELVLAYATTIHKAQGSEYPIVVMPFSMSHFVMLQRNTKLAERLRGVI